MLPGVIDKYYQPPVDEEGMIFEEGRQYYERVCYPNNEQIIKKIAEIRATEDGKRLKNVFLMTNGKPEWIAELKAELQREWNWDNIYSSRDMTLDWEQKHVSAAIDMMIGHRADVFVGNGVSSFFVTELSLLFT